MPFDPSRLICLCAGHEIRRDYADQLAEARPALAAEAVRATWPAETGSCLDLLWAIDPPADAVAFSSRVASLAGGEVAAIVFVARSALLEVSRELPSDDVLAGNLRRLLAGEALTVLDHLVLGFDDRLRPSIGVVAESVDLLPLLERLRRLADETVPVLLTGETGTGKELFARAIHRLGRRSTRPWLALNCAELPDSILESELFGHVRGAFTGAAADRPGLFEAAADGTVFLDEIAELPTAAQAKLLRVLEDHRVRRLGSSEARPLRCRVLAATNRDLLREIDRGRFRADLYYRLRGAEISLAPLRSQPRLLLPLAERFAARARLRFRRSGIRFSDEAKLALAAHGWPGNVRELRQVVEAAVLDAEGSWIRAGDLAIVSRPEPTSPSPAPLPTVRAVERDHILRALLVTSGNKGAAARLLGLSRQSLQRRIERHAIRLPVRTQTPCPEAGAESGRSPSAANAGLAESR